MSTVKEIKVKTKKSSPPPANVVPIRKIYIVDVNSIAESPFPSQVFRQSTYKEEEIKSLGDSILSHGLRQPPQLRFKKQPTTDGKLYEMVFGSRRWLACILKGIPEMQCFIDDLTDEQVLDLQYEENHNRDNPDLLTDAFYFNYQVTVNKKTIRDLMIKHKLDYKTVKNLIKLHYLIDEAKQELAAGHLPEDHALYMAGFGEAAQAEIHRERYAYRYQDAADGFIPFNQFRQVIAENIERRLAEAKFDLEDERLHIHKLKCSACPERKGSDPKFWDEVGDNDVCTNKSCFQQKTNVFLKLQELAIAEENAKRENKPVEIAIQEVPLVATRSYVETNDIPFKKPALINQEIYEKPECEFSELSLCIDGEQKGQKVYICQKDDCPVHHPAPKVSERERHSEAMRREEEFNEKVRQHVRRDILAEALNAFDHYNPFWMFDDLVQQLILRLLAATSKDTAAAVLEIVKPWKVFPKDLSNPLIVKGAVSKLSNIQQSQLIFLLMNASEGFYKQSSQDGLREIAKLYAKVDYRLLDAQTRVFLAPEKYKAQAQRYLDDVRAGRPAHIPAFWLFTTESETEKV